MTVIATPRLVLRPPREEDTPDLVRGLNNFNVSQWTARIPFPYGETDAAEFLKATREAGPGVLRLAITLEDKLIGGIGIEQGEIGYWLEEARWGQGYGREAARAVADHAFENLDYDVLIAGYRIGNEASRRILLALGFRELGETASPSRATGGETIVMRLELARSDWKQARERRR